MNILNMFSACMAKVAAAGRGANGHAFSSDLFRPFAVICASGNESPFATSATCNALKVRVPSAYDLYRVREGREIRKNNPTMPQAAVWTEVSRMWKTLDPKAKEPFENQHEMFRTSSRELAPRGVPSDSIKTAKDLYIRTQMKKRPKEVSAETYEDELNEKWESLPAEEKAAYAAMYRRTRRADRKKRENDASGKGRTLSAYNLYMKEHLVAARRDNPSLKQSEVFKKVVDAWKALLEDEKQHYLEREQKIKEVVRQQAELTPAKPKKWLTGYNLFVRQRMKDRPTDMAAIEYMAEIAKHWQGLSHKQKEAYYEKPPDDVVHDGDEKPQRRKKTSATTTTTKRSTAKKAAGKKAGTAKRGVGSDDKKSAATKKTTKKQQSTTRSTKADATDDEDKLAKQSTKRENESEQQEQHA